MKKLLILFALLVTLFDFAQTKKLTLDVAVMQQNRQFRADKMLGFQWIPNSNNYAFFTDNWTKMMTASTVNSTAVELVSLNSLNQTLKTNLKNFYGVTFIDSNHLLITENATYYSYDLMSKTGTIIQKTNENACP